MSNNKYIKSELLWLLLLALLPVAFLAYEYPSIPDHIATHFNLEGQADAYGSKSSLWFSVWLLAGIGLGVYALTKHLPTIDPKKRTALSGAAYRKTGFAALALLSAISLVIVYTAAKPGFQITRVLFAVLGVFFVYIGNQMHSMKPNYFVGIRIPWTLENEDNWRATHRLGSRVFIIGGLIVALTALVLPARTANICLLVVSGLMALIPIVYSFIYFKKHP